MVKCSNCGATIFFPTQNAPQVFLGQCPNCQSSILVLSDMSACLPGVSLEHIESEQISDLGETIIERIQEAVENLVETINLAKIIQPPTLKVDLSELDDPKRFWKGL